MDGACAITAAACANLSNPEYTYVQASDVAPYFQIAKQYGYANYMFQTNQGPSFPAHQFLLSGTSAPTDISDSIVCHDKNGAAYPCYQWFASENASHYQDPYGCTGQSTVVWGIAPSGLESSGYNSGYPCYNHNTLDTLLDNQSGPISWKYYAQAVHPATSLWTAPNAISGICGLSQDGTSCTGYDWLNNVKNVFPNSLTYPNGYSPILTDLGADPNQPQCTLPAVSWVVPDGNWSDHGGQDPHGAGPSWVAAIVNAVGGYDNSGNQLATHCGYWANTVVLITWDDWGGWYDHVSPSAAAGGPGIGYPGGSGAAYVYGFRVPLLVVSAYAKQGYISGKLPSEGEFPPYIHDFGSILNFIEYVFGYGGVPLSFPGFPGLGISPSYPYADYYAPDGHVVYPPSLYSLSDFFDFAHQRTFIPLTPQQGITYTTQCFLTPKTQGCFGTNFTAADPDDDAVDPQN